MKKQAKVVTASVLGAALLLGGTTYALWSSDTTAGTQAEIQIGGSDLTVLDEGQWTDTVRSQINGAPAVVSDVNAFRAVPGDQLVYSQNYNVAAAGGNTSTKVDVKFDNDAAINVAALRERGLVFKAELRDDKGAVLASSPVDGNTLNTEFVITGATPTTGTNVEVHFVFDFQSTVTAEDTKKLQVLVSNAVVSANQVS